MGSLLTFIFSTATEDYEQISNDIRSLWLKCPQFTAVTLLFSVEP